MPKIKIKFEPRDIWIGVYWNYGKAIGIQYRKLDIYICILPMLPIRLRFQWHGKRQKQALGGEK